MGDHQQSSPYGHHTSEPEDRSERVQEDATLGLQGTVYESWGSRDAKYQDLDDRELGLESQEEEIPPEEVTGEELMDSQHPAEAIAELERVLEKDEEGVPEMSHPVPVSQTGQREGLPCVHLAAPLMGTKVLLSFSGRLSISQRLPSTSAGRERRKRRRLFELAKPKTNWHVLKDRMGCCCRGYAWITPRMRSLQFCVYWPSVYWTERFLEDTTLTITVPEVSRRVEELARPKRFYSECYSNNRCPRCPGQPGWPCPVPGSSSWPSPGLQPPCWKSGTPCRNPSHTCPTTTVSCTWPCPRPSQTSVFLTEIHAGRCWRSPRRQWPVPGSSCWPSPRCGSA
ncbi:sperm microtubule associated protein 2 isoform X7 [Vicugna pacos]|uniref:Sperm microtubule associated protein 2 isoform X7 n=1 Tax=Vicugna pacos TaxID=30538 RepID=A0ABM5C6J9_VICPA